MNLILQVGIYVMGKTVNGVIRQKLTVTLLFYYYDFNNNNRCTYSFLIK